MHKRSQATGRHHQHSRASDRLACIALDFSVRASEQRNLLVGYFVVAFLKSELWRRDGEMGKGSSERERRRRRSVDCTRMMKKLDWTQNNAYRLRSPQPSSRGPVGGGEEPRRGGPFAWARARRLGSRRSFTIQNFMFSYI